MVEGDIIVRVDNVRRILVIERVDVERVDKLVDERVDTLVYWHASTYTRVTGSTGSTILSVNQPWAHNLLESKLDTGEV